MNNYRPLTLKESLNLADKVDEWDYSMSKMGNRNNKKYEIPLFSTLVTKTYTGKLDDLIVRISELELKQRHYITTGLYYILDKCEPPNVTHNWIIEIKYGSVVLNNPKKMHENSILDMYKKIQRKYLHSKKDSRITSSDFKKGLHKSRNMQEKVVK